MLFSFCQKQVAQGDTISECLVNVEEAFVTVREIYEDDGGLSQRDLSVDDFNGPVSIETVVEISIS